MRTRLSNQLKALLKTYFPQALELCGEDLTTPMACALLQKWPSLQQLKKARPETIRRFYYAQNARRGDVIEKRLALIAKAVPLTNDPALIESSIITVQALTLGIARRPHRYRPLRSRDRSHLLTAPRRLSLCRSARQRHRLQRSAPGCLRFSARTFSKRRSDAQLQRHRSRPQTQWTDHHRSSPLCPAALPSPELYRIRQRIDPPQPLGPRLLPDAQECAQKLTGSSSAPWLTNGSASSSAAGRSALLTTNYATSDHCKNAAHPCSNTSLNHQPNPRE